MSSSFSKTSALDPFDQLSLGDSSRSSQSTTPKLFRDGRAARASDVFIALMGVTGSGKSSFISLCCQKAAKVGHELKACTTVVDVYAYELSASRTVYLIDTPGFDDTSRSDCEVLREIAGWLTASYSNEVLLHGIIYLHRITDVRMQGSAKKNLLMFKKLCGDEALQKVVLTTTMWDKVPDREAKDREQQLVDTPEFWGFMVSKGSTVYRHNNTVESAIRIIEELASSNRTVTLDLQNQMVNQNQTLKETAAGRELESEVIKERQKWAAELKDVQQIMEEAIRIRDVESEQAMRELKDDYITRMQRLEHGIETLHIDNERLRNAKIEKLEEAFETQNKAHANELKKLQQKNADLERPVPKSVSSTVSVSSRASQDTKPFHASLCADRWTLLGPETCRVDYKHGYGHSTKERDVGFFVFGAEGAYVQKRQKADGKSETTWSRNLKVQYPRLATKLKHWSSIHVVCIWICLGPKGTFFVKLENGTFDYILPPAISSMMNQIKSEITAVALGKNETYVIVHGNEWTYDLKGYYGNLSTYLEEASSVPRLVALNSHNTTDFLILKNTMEHSLSSSLGNIHFDEFVKWKAENGV